LRRGKGCGLSVSQPYARALLYPPRPPNAIQIFFTSTGAYAIEITKVPDPIDLDEEEAGMSEKSLQQSKKAAVELLCDGLAVSLNPFVQQFIQATIGGMVQALDGVPKNPGTIDIRIRKV
jgi:hypothetical protein